MLVDRAFRLAVYTVVALGALALTAGHLLDPLLLALFLAGLVATWTIHDALGPRAWLTRRGDIIATLTLTALAAADLTWVAGSLLDTFARVVCVLMLVRLATWRITRELRAAGFLSFSMLAAGSAVAFGVAFLPLFITYVAAAIVMLVLFHLVTEAEVAGVTARPLGRGVTIVMGIAALGTLGLTALIFVIIPRVEAALPVGLKAPRALTGFTDRVELGAFGTLETDDAVAMRVRLPDGPVPATLVPEVRWRGLTLDRFDGTMWMTTPRQHFVLRAVEGVPVTYGRHRGRGHRITQEVFLEPIGTDTIFAMAPALQVKLDGAVRVDDSGTLSVPVARSRLTYAVESVLGARAIERLSPHTRERYLQLPPLPPRIVELAQQVTAGSRTDAESAGRLVAWLSRELRYSLDLERRTTLSPLDEFLFVRRTGNCEYFASALAVMLRSLRVPTRVVNGFQRGEWNPYGGYWVVRMRDAHSWVEAHIDGAWVPLDPSPRGDVAPAPLGGLALYIDGLRMHWYRYVVGWSRGDQAHAASTVRRIATSWPPAPQWQSTSGVRPFLIAVLGLAGGIGVLAWLLRRRPGSTRKRENVPAFYARALKSLAHRGLRPAPHETAREFGARAGEALPEVSAMLARLTLAYERMRFGSVDVTPTEARDLVRAASRLRSLRGL
jgi:transglutaminase-like putative cysteine protease